ncbi:TIR domain-containing protein [Mycoplasmatota bacterium]|nr:TIR domain-containing protein [Mycoplasmatota bacterium]
MNKHKTFVSFHSDDEFYKKQLDQLSEYSDLFVNKSVKEGDIPDEWPDERIRRVIRDDFLSDTTVTILLVGKNTMKRKFIDWELHASMINTDKNPQSGIVCVNLPTIRQARRASSEREKQLINKYGNWTRFNNKGEFEKNYPYMPNRIIDNFVSNVDIAVVDWDVIVKDFNVLKELIDISFSRRKKITYNTSSPLRRRNS